MKKILIAVIIILIIIIGIMSYFIFFNKSEQANEQLIFPYKAPQDKTWIEVGTVQCGGNLWEIDWLKSHNDGQSRYPSSGEELSSEIIQIIKNYYNEKEGIIIYDLRVIYYNGPICEACSCTAGYTLYLLIDNTNVEKMLSFGQRYRVYNYYAQ